MKGIKEQHPDTPDTQWHLYSPLGLIPLRESSDHCLGEELERSAGFIGPSVLHAEPTDGIHFIPMMNYLFRLVVLNLASTVTL